MSNGDQELDLTRDVIDWTAVRKWPPSEIECRCGAVFRGYARSKGVGQRFVTFVETPCPGCGSLYDTFVRVSSGPEDMNISNKDIGSA